MGVKRKEKHREQCGCCISDKKRKEKEKTKSIVTMSGVDFFLGNKQRTLTRMLSRQLLLPPQIEH